MFNGVLEVFDGVVVSIILCVNQVEFQFCFVFQEIFLVCVDGIVQFILVGVNGMVIFNVVNGLIVVGSCDVVNGGQLYLMQQQFNGCMDGLEQCIDDQLQVCVMVMVFMFLLFIEEIVLMLEISGLLQIVLIGEGDKLML